ncbi:MAG: hypothetical protein ABI551_07740 [Polyangiaceae bacterium]
MHRARFLVAITFGAFFSAFSASAFACGASSGGVAGLSACSLDAHEEEVRPKWHAGLGFSYTSTALHFDDGSHFDQTRYAALASLEARPFSKLALQFGAGPVFGGTLDSGSEHFTSSAGALLSMSASYRIVDPKGARPFVLGTFGLSFATVQMSADGPQTRSELYDAWDARLGAVVGWSIANVVSPYLLARAFGGPIYWKHAGQDVIGTDVHHYQLGAGLGIAIGKRGDLFVEGAPLGEKNISAGVGLSF